MPPHSEAQQSSAGGAREHPRSRQHSQLRRKTPSGVVDAGYEAVDHDGSAQGAGSPPLKHFIIAATIPAAATTTTGHSGFRQVARPVRASRLSAPRSTRPWDPPPAFQDGSSWTDNDEALGLSPGQAQSSTEHTENKIWTIYRPPAPAMEPFALDLTSYWPAPIRTTASGSHLYSRYPAGNPSFPLSQISHGVCSSHSMWQLPAPSNWAGSAATIDWQSVCARRSLTRVRPQLGSKEKALACGYRSYIDLLACLQASGRPGGMPSGSVCLGGSRLSTYPRPPKPTFGSLQAGPRESSIFLSSLFDVGLATQRPGQAQLALSMAATCQPSCAVSNATNQPKQSLGVSYWSHVQNETTASPMTSAKSALEAVRNVCEQSGWRWLDGMLLGGCLCYGLGRYQDAAQWFSRILHIDSSHVETMTNMAAALYCLDRQSEAEQFWLDAIKLRPSYLEAAEHLVGLLYRKRGPEAVEVISYVQGALRLPDSWLTTQHESRVERKDYGSSGYALPATENGRLLALVHAKGTMLYNLKQVTKAAEAFEEAVLIATGRRLGKIEDIIRRVQYVLCPPGISNLESRRPLMLPPERARCTAQLVFCGAGEPPGLLSLRNGASKRAAVQTTSNSLLSLAKIFQDGLSSGNADLCLLVRPLSTVGDVLALYYLSLSLQESPSTANNIGILLAGLQQTAALPAVFSGRSLVQGAMPSVRPGSGMSFALAYYNYGLGLDPKHVHLHTNLGSLVKDMGLLDLAISMYERAVACDASFDIALTNLANAVKDKGRINDAIVYYRRAVAANPAFCEAVCGLFTALNSVCDWQGRGGVYLACGKYDRWHVDEQGVLHDVLATGRGSGLTQRVVDIVAEQLREASLWGQHALEASTRATLAHELEWLCQEGCFRLEDALQHWAGRPWEGARLVRLLERAARVTQHQWYKDVYVSWRRGKAGPYTRPSLPRHLSVPTTPTVLPFHTFTCPLAAREIRAISQRNALRITCSTLRSSWLPASVYPPPRPPQPQLNVGYVSSDFNNHPLAHLMQSVFGLHNSNRVRAFCYATTSSDNSTHRRQIEREAPVFREVSNWPLDKVIDIIIQDEIHILVNLNGYTRGARNEIFAARPVPVQMSFMGFAGSLGAEWCDYILADATAIPPETLRPWRSNTSIQDVFHDGNEDDDYGEWVYSENIIFCRDTFFCCDHAQSCDANERATTWHQEQQRRWAMRKAMFPGMADDVIILANFNQLYKIEPTTFRSWLRILARVPKAVLWLLRFPEAGERNLRVTAEAWAGSEVASRVFFTDVAAKSHHISRARVCDLFLDTPECNAHTTAADVLWSSTPLLTLPRYPYKMCSRMAASILRGALPRSSEGRRVAEELIVKNEAEYESAAVRLASGLRYARVALDEPASPSPSYCEGHGRLAEMRRLLWDSKWICGLFDTQRWVDDVETAYYEAWRRWVHGIGGDIYL
ncbi:hypothetical protein CDD81_4586 [Ophiocordyceps australis]|uniref:protein O-GlcNAc transferase n=1 Tax=Ophiocordyceps australis TaxID=1399860 RepID=A0A2C5XVZ1_9HYPO|nr:hypothetical protein CDD81_4586 [Ophiocordyceps australis]